MRISDWSSDVCSSDLDKIFTYVTVRRGYRAGGINTPGFSAVLAPFQYFGPQKVNDVEIGAKTQWSVGNVRGRFNIAAFRGVFRSEEHTSELQSLMRLSYAVFCLKKKKR